MTTPSNRSDHLALGVAAVAMLLGALVMRSAGDLRLLGGVPQLLFGASMMLAAYYAAIWRSFRAPGIILGVAVVTRVILLGQVPGDDIFRYIWEGQLLLDHINPYLHAPDAAELIPLRDSLWDAVGHKSFSAIYPPLAEWSFAFLAALSPSVMFFKGVFAAADLFTGWLLARKYGWQAGLIFLWNPLVLVAFSGGGHYDSLFVLALVLGWLAWEDHRWRHALLWLGSAVAIKWMALPLLAWVVWRRFRGPGLAAAGIALAWGLLPLLLAWFALSVWTMEWSRQLHPAQFSEFARSAEFIPRLVGEVWESRRIDNTWILLPLALAWGVVILRAKSFLGAAEGTLFFTLILSPVIHIWYFTWLIPFAVVSRNRGTLLLTASGFIYFALYHRLAHIPQAPWQLTLPETLFLWLPLVLGFLWTWFPTRWKNPFSATTS